MTYKCENEELFLENLNALESRSKEDPPKPQHMLDCV